MGRGQKYNAVPTLVDGIRFDSRAEARRYTVLAQKVEAGLIRDLRLQPRFRLEVNGMHIAEYRADFSYVRAADGAVVVEDVKGRKTREYQIKARLVEAIHGVRVVEIPA